MRCIIPHKEVAALGRFVVMTGFVSELRQRQGLQRTLTNMGRSGPQAGDLTLIEQHLLVARLLSTLLEAAAGRLGMTLTQARVLACIYRLERDAEVVVVPTRIGEQIGYSKAHVSEALGALSQSGYITKMQAEAGDRRLSRLKLTADGLGRAERLVAAMLSAEIHIRDSMKVVARSRKLDRLAFKLAEMNDDR